MVPKWAKMPPFAGLLLWRVGQNWPQGSDQGTAQGGQCCTCSRQHAVLQLAAAPWHELQLHCFYSPEPNTGPDAQKP